MGARRVFSVAVVLLLGSGLAVAETPGSSERWSQGEAEVACLLGRVSGFDGSDAEAVAGLICGELRELGVPVGEPVTDPGRAQEAYRIDMSRLGTALVLEVGFESPVGERLWRVRQQLPGIEAVFDAAPDLALELTLEGDPDAPPLAELSVPVTTSGRPVCLVGEHGGIPLEDARTITALVCDELRAQGIPVDAPQTSAEGAEQAYRTNLRPLGGAVFLEVTHESPPGVVREARRLQAAYLEEAAVAAPRAARALALGIPVEETATVGTLVGDETREVGVRPGTTFWGVGISGFVLPGTNVALAPGLNLKFFYEGLQYGVGGDMLFGGLSGDDATVFFALSVGARYFFSDTSHSPYAGGGFAWHTLASQWEDGREGTATGVGVYGEVGWEFLRDTSSRLMAGLRLDAPFFTVARDDTNTGERRDGRYILPVSLTVAFGW